MMPEYVSPLDEDYISLGRAAALTALEHPGTDASQILDMFKRAIFSGELDPPLLNTVATRDHPGNWLHMEIEAPKCTLSQVQAALPIRPRQLYGVNSETVASVLLTTEALPGDARPWWPLFDTCAPTYQPEDALSALAAIPFRDFPQRGQQELEAILIPKPKLALWFGQQSQRMPAFLSPSTIAKGSEQSSTQPTDKADAFVAGSRPQGRPHKAAWPRVVQLVHQLRSEHPDWQKRRLAYEAWQLASREFNKSELPSVATIQRRMAGILGGGSGD